MSIDLDALEREVNEYPDDATFNGEVIELIQRLREAEKDKARLDFMIAEGCEIRRNSYSNKFYLLWNHENGCSMQVDEHEVPRDAIDAAIDQQRAIATGEDIGL